MYRYLTAAATLTCLLSTSALAQHTGDNLTGGPMITPPPATTVVPKTTSATGVGVGIANSASQSGAVAISGQGGRGGNSSLTINNPANTTSTATINQNLSGTTTQNINSKVSGSTRTEVVSSGTTTVKNVPSTVAPGLAAAGLETCLGSASGTVSLAGLGIGGGSTYRDEDCTARLDSRTLFAMGLKGAAVARLCVRPDIWRSMPDICAQYWPVGQPLPQGIYIAAPLVAPAGTYMSTSLRVIDGRDGVEKDCLNYNATKFRCNQWAGEAPKRQRSAALTPAKKPLPSHQTKPKIDPPQLPTEITAGSPAPSNQ